MGAPGCGQGCARQCWSLETVALSKSTCRVLQSHRKERRESLRLRSVAPLPACRVLAQHLRRCCLPCSTSLTCTGVWGITAGRQKWDQAYPSPPSHSDSPSPLMSLTSYPTPVSLQPFLFGEPASVGGGVRVYQENIYYCKERIYIAARRIYIAARREYKLPPVNHCDITVFPGLSAFWLTAVLCVSTPGVSPALMSHVDTPVPVAHILFPFLASLAPHSIGLGHEFRMCLQMVSHFAFETRQNSSLYDS